MTEHDEGRLLVIAALFFGAWCLGQANKSGTVTGFRADPYGGDGSVAGIATGAVQAGQAGQCGC